jgi:hypothetical protein
MSGTVTFSDGTNNAVLTTPRFGYKSSLFFPFDIQELDDNTIDIYDHGSSYDKRICDCTFELTQAEMETLCALVRTDAKGRAKKLTMTLSSGSGFFPFMPDKGDADVFTVSLEITAQKQVEEPQYYHTAEVHIINCGTWPSYSIPTEVKDGNSQFQIGTVQYLRFPPNWFDPSVRYNYHAQIMEDSDVEFVDRGLGDYYATNMILICNQTKAAKLIKYLTTVTVARANQFSIITDSNFFAFGNDKGGAATYQVKMNGDRIDVVNDRYNSFRFSLPLIYING